jgi:hypothetical protein
LSAAIACAAVISNASRTTATSVIEAAFICATVTPLYVSWTSNPSLISW